MHGSKSFRQESNLHQTFQSQELVQINNSNCPILEIHENSSSNTHTITILENHTNTSNQHDQSEESRNFSISPEILAQLVESKDANFLIQFGGPKRVASLLETDIQNGIPGDQYDLDRRLKCFGSNQNQEGNHHQSSRLGVHRLAFEAFKDTTIILLLCCAVLSLAIGIKINGPQEGIVDGILVFFFILVLVYFGVICQYIKSRWMVKKRLKQKKFTYVVRSGQYQKISASEVVVGDIVCLQKGSEVPADGLFINDDDSSFKLDCGHKASNFSNFPSLFTGAKVAEGECKMLVTSVGEKTERSKLMGLLGNNSHKSNGFYDSSSKLQLSIDKMSSNLENVWLILSLIVLVVQVLRCFVWESKYCNRNHNPDQKGVKDSLQEVAHESAKILKKQTGKVNGLVAMLCILMFALRDCLPLGIFTTFFYASKKLKPFRAIIQKLPACATLGWITTICICNTEDLALKYSNMADLWIGMKEITQEDDNISKEVDHRVVKFFQEAIFCTSDAAGVQEKVEEDALFCWAEKVLSMDVETIFKSCSLNHSEAPDLYRNYCSVIPIQPADSNHVFDVYWKGDPGMILPMCSHYFDVDGTMQELDEENRENFNKIIEDIVSTSSLGSYAFAYKQIFKKEYDGEEFLDSFEDGLIMLGLVNLKNPYPPEVIKSVEACVKSGVTIKLVVDDDLKTAGFMARFSGILGPGKDLNQAVIEASIFRKSSPEERLKMIDSIHVLADASPEDKLWMVQCLKQKSEVVAVTGRCSRDLPSLIEADVGLLMGDHCAECIKEYVEVVVFGLSIGMISTLVRFGRTVCQNLEKFINFQLPITVAAFGINFIVVLTTNEVQFTAFQLLWVNIVMEVLGSLALSIQMVELLPSETTNQVEKTPNNLYGTGSVVTKTMWRNIAFRSLFQVSLMVILSMKGGEILDADEGVLKTMIFLFYVMCQVFALVGSMEINEASFLEGLGKFKNHMFLIIVGMIVVMNFALIEIMAVVAHWRKINLGQWCICTGLAVLPMPIDYVVTWIKHHLTPLINV